MDNEAVDHYDISIPIETNMTNSQINQLSELARRIRRDILVSTTTAGSGHPSSSLSAVELMTVLFFGGIFQADLKRPDYPGNDRLIFSKGHAAPLLYALYAAAGRVAPKELRRLRQFASRLEGHPAMKFPYTEAPTGSLGQGLSIGVGLALAGRIQRLRYQAYVLLGDSELAEGSIWEAAQLASHEKLDRLTAIVDASRLGQSGPTMVGHQLAVYERRFAAFDWRTVTVDGHDLEAVHLAYKQSLAGRGQPTVILAKTFKGRGVPFIENKNGWHGKALSPEQLKQALTEIGTVSNRTGSVRKSIAVRAKKPGARAVVQPRYSQGEEVSTRRAFGNALVRLASAQPNMVVLDGEVMNSTYTELFAKKFPQRFIQGYIAEQNMIGMAVGLARRGLVPVAATFAAFLSRAFDQLRMAQYADVHLVVAGTHAGVSIGQDGPSQMGLEDIAMFRTLQNATILYPSDAWSAEQLVDQALKAKGIVYLRLTRGDTPLLYKSATRFPIGGSQTLRSSRRDQLTIVGAGITVHEALVAADELVKQQTAVRVLDCYSLKPIDAVTLRQAARQTKQLVVVEDHHPEGGLADAVRTALGPLAGCVTSLAVTKRPTSGTPSQLLKQQGIDRSSIIRAAKRLVKRA